MKINYDYLDITNNKQIRHEDIDFIFIHHLGGREYYDYKLFIGEIGTISTYYYILKSGEVRQYVSNYNIAYHTGTTELIDYQTTWGYNLNPASIGIELENLGDREDEYTEEQIKSLEELVIYLKGEYRIETRNIIGHKEVTNRKIDPSSNFYNGDMDGFREYIEYTINGSTGEYDNITKYDIFNSYERDKDIKQLIEIGLYRRDENEKKGTLKIRE